MRGLDVVNPRLAVEAVGFAPWDGHWLGVLLTPWCMNLMLLPRDRGALAAARRPARSGATRSRPASTNSSARTTRRSAPYAVCSLFSPVLQFADQETAGRSRRSRARRCSIRRTPRCPSSRPRRPTQPSRRPRPPAPRPRPARSRRSSGSSTRRCPSATSCAGASSAPIVTIEGELTVRLAWDGGRVRDVAIASSRPFAIARVLAGRTADEAAAIVPRLYSLCAGAQGAAAATALDAAGARDAGSGPARRARDDGAARDRAGALLAAADRLAEGDGPRRRDGARRRRAPRDRSGAGAGRRGSDAPVDGRTARAAARRAARGARGRARLRRCRRRPGWRSPMRARSRAGPRPATTLPARLLRRAPRRSARRSA